jgi:hypothetical protein
MDKQIDMMDDKVLSVTEEPTTCLNEDLLQSFKKHKIDIGQDYHLTEKEICRIAEEAEWNCEELQQQYNEAIKAEDIALKLNDPDLISEANKNKRRLEHLLNMEQPIIKAAAIEILKYGDPVDYIMKVYNLLHVGDTAIGKILLLSVACQSVLNSEGLQPKLSGASGKGKTHATKAMFHLIPDVGYKLEGSLSAKSLFYHPDLKAGTIVFSDDVKIKGDLEDTLKRSMTNFQQKTTHMTVVNSESKTLEIPERTTWWMTSVSNPFGDELLNRLFGLDVDDSVNQDSAVTQQQLYQAEFGEVSLPENKNDINICRAIIHIVKGKLFRIDIPFADRIIWKGSGDRRNLPRFLDLIKAFAAMRFMQRDELFDDEIFADDKDFEDAKALYEQGKTGLTTKLTEAELRLVKFMVGKEALSVNDIVKSYMKPKGEPYTSEAIRKMLEGTKGGKGLTDKVPGMLSYGSGGKGDEKKYEIPSFDDNSTLEIVSLTPW